MHRSRALRTCTLTAAALAVGSCVALGQAPAEAPTTATAPPTPTAPTAPTAPTPPMDPVGTTLVGRVVAVTSPTTLQVRSQGRVVTVTMAGVGDPGAGDSRAACLREASLGYLQGRLQTGMRVTVRSRAEVRRRAVTGWVYLGSNTGAGSVNRALVMAGYAPVSATIARAQFAAQLRAAEKRARTRKAGRWGQACSLSTTKGVQRRLVSLGYLPTGAANGTLDYRTQQAIMAFQGWSGLNRDGALGDQTRKRLAGATRPVPDKRSSGRHMEVHINRQVLLLVENGRTVRAIHVSSGGRTPRGRFTIIRRELNSWSVPFSVTLPYAQYFYGGFAFHQYPHVPGYPASHGCIRLPSPEAPVVWNFGAYGMPVTVG